MLYVVDEIRRVVTETLIPYLTQGSASITKKVKEVSINSKNSDLLKRIKSGEADDSEI